MKQSFVNYPCSFWDCKGREYGEATAVFPQIGLKRWLGSSVVALVSQKLIRSYLGF
jgi:hypothetical protein